MLPTSPTSAVVPMYLSFYDTQYIELRKMLSTRITETENLLEQKKIQLESFSLEGLRPIAVQYASLFLKALESVLGNAVLC